MTRCKLHHSHLGVSFSCFTLCRDGRFCTRRDCAGFCSPLHVSLAVSCPDDREQSCCRTLFHQSRHDLVAFVPWFCSAKVSPLESIHCGMRHCTLSCCTLFIVVYPPRMRLIDQPFGRRVDSHIGLHMLACRRSSFASRGRTLPEQAKEVQDTLYKFSSSTCTCTCSSLPVL